MLFGQLDTDEALREMMSLPFLDAVAIFTAALFAYGPILLMGLTFLVGVTILWRIVSMYLRTVNGLLAPVEIVDAEVVKKPRRRRRRRGRKRIPYATYVAKGRRVP